MRKSDIQAFQLMSIVGRVHMPGENQTQRTNNNQTDFNGCCCVGEAFSVDALFSPECLPASVHMFVQERIPQRCSVSSNTVLHIHTDITHIYIWLSAA